MRSYQKASFSKSSNALFLVFFLCLSLVGVSAGLAADELKIAYNTGVAPLKFEDQAGQPAGMFPDLWRLWAEKTGKEIHFVKADTFGASLQMLKDGAVDLHAGLFKTPERENFLDSSEPFLTLDYYTFTHPSVYPIKTLERTSGLIVGVPEGGFTERYVRSIVPVPLQPSRYSPSESFCPLSYQKVQRPCLNPPR